MEDAKAESKSQEEATEGLKTRIHELEATISSLKADIENLEKKGEASQTAAEAASVEHDALVKAQEDFKAISVEAENLKEAHTKALQDYETQLTELREKASEAEALTTQMASLKVEREENANKLSELEIEILELKEAQEELEDAKATLKKQVTSLEDELAKAAVSTGLVAESVSQKENEYTKKIEELLVKHQQELEVEAARYVNVVESLEALKAEHSNILEAQKQLQAEYLEKEGLFDAKHTEALKEHESKQAALSADIDRISKELQVSRLIIPD